MKRVVITGLGIISPVGNNICEFREAIMKGRCGIDKITKFDTSEYKVKLAAEVKNFDPLKYFDSVVEVRRADLYTQYAIAAADEAVNDSGINVKNTSPERLGVYIGSGIGGMNTFITELTKLNEKGPSRVSPLFIPMMIANMAAGMVAIRHSAKGPTLPVVTACATSTNTIGEAFRAIRHGYADAIIAGGSEATINGLTVAGFTNCRALTESVDPSAASLPFDARREGFVLGEGAGMLIIEEYEHAIARGAKIYAEIKGYGNTCDAYHMTAPDPEANGAAAAIRMAAQESGILSQEVNKTSVYVNAHGTGTHLNDVAETLALKKVFGSDAYKLHISSTKSVTGHMLGATGAVEAIASVLALECAIVPPTANYLKADPECNLDYTPNTATRASLEYAISNSLGFGGHNASIVFKKL